jgi:hypothetical protein
MSPVQGTTAVSEDHAVSIFRVELKIEATRFSEILATIYQPSM